MAETYTSLGPKGFLRRHFLSDMASQSLEDLVFLAKDSPALINKEKVLKAFCEAIKTCLEQEDLKLCLQAFFRMEHHLQELETQLDDLPHLREFYEILSPTLLRVLWEGLEGQLGLEELKERWLEALRVSLEEELYLWQEKIVN